MPLRTSTWMPPRMTSPSTRSKLSSSARPSATGANTSPEEEAVGESVGDGPGPASLQDQADGANRRRSGEAAREPLTVNGRGPELTEVTGVAQLLADRQHPVLQGALRAIDGRGQAAGAVRPVHPVQALAPRPARPSVARWPGPHQIGQPLGRIEAPHRTAWTISRRCCAVSVFCSWQTPHGKVSRHAKREGLTSECLRPSDFRVVALARLLINGPLGTAGLPFSKSSDDCDPVVSGAEAQCPAASPIHLIYRKTPG